MAAVSLLDSYRAAVRHRSGLDPAEWSAKNVRLFRSTDAQHYRPEYTPWWSEVMREIRNNANREICFTGPVGCGKSTMIEAMACNIIEEDPGPILITGQTNEDIRDWAETGLWPTMKACPPIEGKLPTGRGVWRKMELVIPRSPIHLTGANMSGLQSKSERWCIGDEAWMWKGGMIQEMRKRLHRRWNGRVILMGQAGFKQVGENDELIGDDFTVAHDDGEQLEWCFACPECSSVQSYQLQQLKFPGDGAIADRAVAVQYECVECGTQFPDTINTRRLFVQSSRWVKMREARVPGHLSFHMNAIALWRSPWSDIVAEYLKAAHSMRQGQYIPMQQFVQKQMAEPWDDSLAIERSDIDVAGPAEADLLHGEELDGEAARFMSIDVQRDHFWVMVRAWRGDASSVGFYYAKVQTEETIEELRKRMNIPPRHVLIDSGYEAGRVYDACARYDWVAIKGDNTTGYTHVQRRGPSRLRLYSPIKRVVAPCGMKVPLIHLAVNPLKDMLARLRNGVAAPWQVTPDLPADHLKQLDSEVKEEFTNPKDNQPTTRWVRKRRSNHAWDCEVYQVGAALMFQLFAAAENGLDS